MRCSVGGGRCAVGGDGGGGGGAGRRAGQVRSSAKPVWVAGSDFSTAATLSRRAFYPSDERRRAATGGATMLCS